MPDIQDKSVVREKVVYFLIASAIYFGGLGLFFYFMPPSLRSVFPYNNNQEKFFFCVMLFTGGHCGMVCRSDHGLVEEKGVTLWPCERFVS